jgi:hypothetical protein
MVLQTTPIIYMHPVYTNYKVSAVDTVEVTKSLANLVDYYYFICTMIYHSFLYYGGNVISYSMPSKNTAMS